MFNKIKSRMIRITGPYGVYKITRFLSRNQPRVLMYHRFSAGNENNKVAALMFERQMAELKNNFNVMALSSVCDHIRNNRPLPGNTILLTIDDGYADFYQYAYPVLNKYGLPATIYITTDFIDGKIWLWPDKITFILENSLFPRLMTEVVENMGGVAIVTQSEREHAWNVLIDYCLLLDEKERINFIDHLAVKQGVTINHEPADKYAPMTWDEIIDISRNGIDIGAHTKTHPVLSKLNVKQLRTEISGSKNRIEEMIQKPVFNFCYPNGQPSDYNGQVKKVVIDSGYISATVAFHDKHIWSDLYEIRRHGVGNSLFQYKKAVYGAEYLASLFK